MYKSHKINFYPIVKRINKCVNETLKELPLLPCRADEMNERELKMYNMLTTLCGTIQAIKDWTTIKNET